MKKKFIGAFLALTLLVTGAVPVYAAESDQVKDTIITTLKNSEEFNKLSYEDVELFLNAIVNIPDDLLMSGNQQAIKDYLQTEGVILTDNTESNEIETRGAWDVAKCAGAIAWVIGSTVFAGAKILKIKKYVKALGGVKEAATLLMMYFQYKEVPPNLGEKLGSSLMNLASEVLGISTVRDNCM